VRNRGGLPEDYVLWENALNDRLARDYGPQHRVCVHPNRTSTPLPEGGWLVECDYCPGVAKVRAGDIWPDITPVYYTDTDPLYI
jgi:hypothetical protein